MGEWPDRSLWDRFREAVAAGHAGIPRDELLDALLQAARALDYLNALSHPFVDAFSESATKGPGISHGDVAPRSILYVGGGVKLADIDPLRRVGFAHHESQPPAAPLYPDYAAPERLAGRVSRHSDQFSLALTYLHLLTGRPIGPRHLANVPEAEHHALARALNVDPAGRWPSSQAFLDALRTASKPMEPRPTRSLPAPVPALEPTRFGELSADCLARETFPIRGAHRRRTVATIAAGCVAASLALVGTLSILSRYPTNAESYEPTSLTNTPPEPSPRVRFQSTTEEPTPSEEPRPVAPVSHLPAPLRIQECTPPPAKRDAETSPPRVPTQIQVEAPASVTLRNGVSTPLDIMVSGPNGAGLFTVHLADLPRGVVATTAHTFATIGPRSPIRVQVVLRVEDDAPEATESTRVIATCGTTQSVANLRIAVRPSPSVAARQ